MGSFQTPFKLTKHQDLNTPFGEVYGTNNSKKFDMLMNMYIELQAENLQLQKTVVQFQRRVDALENTVDNGCQQMQKLMQTKTTEQDAANVQEEKKWTKIVSKKNPNTEHTDEPVKSSQVPPCSLMSRQEDVHEQKAGEARYLPRKMETMLNRDSGLMGYTSHVLEL